MGNHARHWECLELLSDTLPHQCMTTTTMPLPLLHIGELPYSKTLFLPVVAVAVAVSLVVGATATDRQSKLLLLTFYPTVHVDLLLFMPLVDYCFFAITIDTS